MTIQQATNYVAFLLGQTFQDIKEIWPNAQALYHHGDLQQGEVHLSDEEVISLRIHMPSRLSDLFIFRDYFFEWGAGARLGETRVRILPNYDDQPDSLISLFSKESLCRIAKAVAALALVLLTAPLSMLFFTGAYLCNFNTTFTSGWTRGTEATALFFARERRIIPEEPADSHVTAQDILRIGRALVGYRHVSTEELAQVNARDGIPDGCSLNISFCRGEGLFSQALFEALDEKVVAGENCDQLIRQYENAITEFISQSIRMDLPQEAWTYENILETLQRSRFMIVKTGAGRSSDTHAYGKLGRFPKESISPEGVTLLRRIQRGELGIQERRLPQQLTPQHMQTLIAYISSFYRRELLSYIRQDFDPAQFHSQLSSRLYHQAI